MQNKIVAIIGAGVMGCATALDVAWHGHNVILKDISTDVLNIAENRIRQEYRSACIFRREYREISIDDIINRIRIQSDYDGIQEADIVIENIIEDVESKILEYGRLKELCKHALYALNTSCLPITKLASYLPNPSKVIGVHFMNPVPLKETVEVIKGYHTSAETENDMVEFLVHMKKRPIVIQDFPGFVSNRLSHLFMNEAAFAVQDGVATPTQVDEIMCGGFNHKMGPLRTADLIGLDTVANSLDVLYRCYQDSKFRCCPLLRKMVDAGKLGVKSGEGFFKY